MLSVVRATVWITRRHKTRSGRTYVPLLSRVASRVGLAVPQALHAAPHDPYRPARVDARLEDRRARDEEVGPWIGLAFGLGLVSGSGLGVGLGVGLGLGLEG